jgi:hypothetical protein
MSDQFQRLFMMSEPKILPLNEQAALGPLEPPRRSQFVHLVRLFLERFFHHQAASPDGDAKARLILLAFAAGIPGLMVSVYLWPVYHPMRGWPPDHPSNGGPPPYWLQVNHHFFFALYSFVVIGIVTVFEWDLFFPDLLDVQVLTTLPISSGRLFRARIAAVAIFVAGFLFDANILAPLILPEAIDPPSLLRFLGGHLSAVLLAGVFAAALVVALQGLLLALFGERLFRKLSLLLQGLLISLLLLLLLLFPVLSGVVPTLLQSGRVSILCFPPFWFLGLYQRLMEGPAALPVYVRLARIGCMATMGATALAVLVYPMAYRRRVRQLVEGAATRSARDWMGLAFERLLNAVIVRLPVRRAVFHFVGPTLVRVPRYRIYLVLYGAVGLSVVSATLLRFTAVNHHVRVAIAVDGVRAAQAVAAFWMVAGLRVAFLWPADRSAGWIFRLIQGDPPELAPALNRRVAAERWALLAAGAVTFGGLTLSRLISPPGLLSLPATAAQWLVSAAMCLLLTDIFFLHVTDVPFAPVRAREEDNLALTLLKFFTFFPLIAWIPLAAEPWIEGKGWHFAAAGAVAVAAHLGLRTRRHRVVRAYTSVPGLEEGEEDFPMKLGLRT